MVAGMSRITCRWRVGLRRRLRRKGRPWVSGIANLDRRRVHNCARMEEMFRISTNQDLGTRHAVETKQVLRSKGVYGLRALSCTLHNIGTVLIVGCSSGKAMKSPCRHWPEQICSKGAPSRKHYSSSLNVRLLSHVFLYGAVYCDAVQSPSMRT
jgi:hypothetical protein